MPARNQGQVDTGYIDEQGHRDTKDSYPKPPIAVRTLPVGTMNMRFIMVTVLELIHLCAAFLDRQTENPDQDGYEYQSRKDHQEHRVSAIQQ
jgi:hypothetical protein